MLVIDTSAWIEFLIGTPAGRTVNQHLPDLPGRLVPTIVQLELAKWFTRENGHDAADRVIALTKVCTIVPLDAELALAAADACRSHRLATADAIIFATAQAHDAELLTCDSDFADLPGVIYVPKA